MKTTRENLPTDQAKRIQTMMVSNDFINLRQCIAAELTEYEARLIESDIWIDEQDLAKAKTKNLRISARKYLNALEVLDEMSKDGYSFHTVNITTS